MKKAARKKMNTSKVIATPEPERDIIVTCASFRTYKDLFEFLVEMPCGMYAVEVDYESYWYSSEGYGKDSCTWKYEGVANSGVDAYIRAAQQLKSRVRNIIQFDDISHSRIRYIGNVK